MISRRRAQQARCVTTEGGWEMPGSSRSCRDTVSFQVPETSAISRANDRSQWLLREQRQEAPNRTEQGMGDGSTINRLALCG
jgi:hypothetical protein